MMSRAGRDLDTPPYWIACGGCFQTTAAGGVVTTGCWDAITETLVQ